MSIKPDFSKVVVRELARIVVYKALAERTEERIMDEETFFFYPDGRVERGDVILSQFLPPSEYGNMKVSVTIKVEDNNAI